MFKNKYRIKSVLSYYSVDIKRWWLPFWFELDVLRLHKSMEEAEQYIENHKKYGNGSVVKNYEG